MARPARVEVGDIVLGGKYRVERLVGEGGMGVVVLARHVELGQAVAIKVLRDDSDEDVVKRFIREARSAVRLTGDHVVRVHDVGTLQNGAPYMLMDYLEGEDLGAIVARGALEVGDAADYVLQACEGIAEAHALGIVHRDLKPQNLFLVRRTHQRPIVKVLDFGIAKSFQATDDVSLTATHAILGSPAYMSPEQMRASRDVDARTDVWSLGVVLYELLTGALPFEGQTVAEVSAGVLMKEPAALDQRRADIPTAIQKVIALCLAKDVASRLPSVADLAVALEPFAPILARGTADRLLRLLETRHPSMMGNSEGTSTERTSGPVSHAGLLPTLAAMANVAPANPAVRTAATFESLGPSLVARERSLGKFVALGAVGVALLGGLVFAIVRTPSADRGATADDPARARPAAASSGSVGATGASSSLVPSSQQAASSEAVAPAPPVTASVDAGPRSPTGVRRPGSRPLPATPKADAGSNGAQYF